jgi:hypothetical protein
MVKPMCVICGKVAGRLFAYGTGHAHRRCVRNAAPTPPTAPRLSRRIPDGPEGNAEIFSRMVQGSVFRQMVRRTDGQEEAQ